VETLRSLVTESCYGVQIEYGGLCEPVARMLEILRFGFMFTQNSILTFSHCERIY